ncbi:MAG: VOC family protein [Hyphomonadaceae bacterium]|nr:VOC family protein [Hyphomonadaceae bacterium]MBP9233740.1 VOC family protein [Hyphomonadaceae bacterium]
MEINGIAHIQITAGRYDEARAFYSKLLPFLGLKQVLDNEYGYYCVGGRTGVLISKPAPEYDGERFVQTRVGLHHVCFRARSREDVDEAHAFLKTLGATIVRAPQEDGWAPGYYSILFEDPDGVRLELNFVPGKGVFATDEKALKSTYPKSILS